MDINRKTQTIKKLYFLQKHFPKTENKKLPTKGIRVPITCDSKNKSEFTEQSLINFGWFTNNVTGNKIDIKK